MLGRYAKTIVNRLLHDANHVVARMATHLPSPLLNLTDQGRTSIWIQFFALSLLFSHRNPRLTSNRPNSSTLKLRLCFFPFLTTPCRKNGKTLKNPEHQGRENRGKGSRLKYPLRNGNKPVHDVNFPVVWNLQCRNFCIAVFEFAML